jgi:hypothetical protein
MVPHEKLGQVTGPYLRRCTMRLPPQIAYLVVYGETEVARPVVGLIATHDVRQEAHEASVGRGES